jgi:hypothetical protein
MRPFFITDITVSGLYTTIPQLESGEKFYFHYILAENPCREAVNCPGEPDLSTWIAVEQSKQQLETAAIQQAKKPRLSDRGFFVGKRLEYYCPDEYVRSACFCTSSK